MRARRLDLELEQKDIAHIFCVSLDTIANWELNHTAPGIWLGKQIIEFLGYNPLPDPQSLTDQLLSYRWREGLRCDEASERLQVDPATWSSWERDEHAPTRPSREKLRAIGIML